MLPLVVSHDLFQTLLRFKPGTSQPIVHNCIVLGDLNEQLHQLVFLSPDTQQLPINSKQLIYRNNHTCMLLTYKPASEGQ